MGIVYQPMPDTGMDTVHVAQHRATTPPYYTKDNANKVYDDGSKTSADYRLDIRQGPSGMAVTKPYGEGTVFMPIHAEQIILSPDAETVTTHGNVSIISPQNDPDIFDGKYKDYITVNGKGNTLSLSCLGVDETVVLLNPGAQLQVTLRDAKGYEPSNLNNLMMPDYSTQKTPPGKLTAHWQKDTAGGYHITVSDAKNPSGSIYFSITLEDAEPLDRAKFEVALNQGLDTWQTVKGPDGKESPQRVHIPLSEAHSSTGPTQWYESARTRLPPTTQR
jgi:hypothetical protein